ncbi:MAG: GNAT family N-acetyltransferase [Bacilli bacterium]|nr:GNAT family N-acetyltransferase [Bacilli bacterium]
MIKEITNEIELNRCDELLNLLILDERKYDQTIDEYFKVKDYFKNVIKGNNFLLGYIIDDKIVGYIFIKNIDNSNYLIDGLYVEEEYRRRGIGKKLINKALELCKQRNAKCIDINVMYKNDLAKNLYKLLGFEEFRMTLRKEL